MAHYPINSLDEFLIFLPRTFTEFGLIADTNLRFLPFTLNEIIKNILLKNQGEKYLDPNEHVTLSSDGIFLTKENQQGQIRFRVFSKERYGTFNEEWFDDFEAALTAKIDLWGNLCEVKFKQR